MAISSELHSNLSSSKSPDSNLNQLFDDLKPLNPKPIRQWPLIHDISDESSAFLEENVDESNSFRKQEDLDRMLNDSLVAGENWFGNEPSLNYTSFYVDHELCLNRLRTRCQCSYSIPNKDDRIWMMPKSGWHAIPLVLFDNGFHLPMHPFHSRVLEAIGCGLSQLAPNAYLQISGVIARCVELKMSPSLELLFSIYELKIKGGIYHLSTRSKRTSLVWCLSSNKGWHKKWVYFHGDVLELIGPWREIPSAHSQQLNRMPRVPDSVLNEFYGTKCTYDYRQFLDPQFLEEHHLGGATLLRVVEAGARKNMPSDSLKATLLRKGKVNRNQKKSPSVSQSVSGNARNIDSQVKSDLEILDRSVSDSDPNRIQNKSHSYVSGDPKKIPIISPQVDKAGQGCTVVVKPGQKWTTGHSPPVQVFEGFRLVDDTDYYIGTSRKEIASRCMERMGRVLSDFVRITDVYAASSETDKEKNQLQAEVKSLKKALSETKTLKGDVERLQKDKFVLREHLSTATTKLESLQKQNSRLEGEKSDLIAKMKDLNQRGEKAEASVVELTAKLGSCDSGHRDELKHVRSVQHYEFEKLQKELANTRNELEKSRDEIAGAFEDGFNTSTGRFKKVGINVAGNTFQDYCDELAEEEVRLEAEKAHLKERKKAMAEDTKVVDTETSKVTTTAADGGQKGKWRRGWRYGGWSGYGSGKGSSAGRKMWRSFAQFILVLLVLFAVIALILWLIYRPHKPKFTLVSAAVFNLSTSTPPFISTTMQFTVVIRNPNDRASIYYDRLSAFVSYKNQRITPQLNLPPLHQRKDSRVAMSPILGGAAVPVSLGVANDILMDMEGYGLVQLRLVLQGRIKYKAGGIKTSHYDLYVSCDMLLGLKKGMVGQVPILGTNHEDRDQDHHACKVDL